MNKKYTARDIIEMAIQAKGRGIKLYLALARDSENYHVGRLFVELAKDEERHKLELKKWIDKTPKSELEEAYPGERSLYFKSLVDANTFVCNEATERALEKTINEEDALEAGINFEKDFMLFMHDLRQNSSPKAAETIDSIIEDEIRHLREIFKLRDKA